MLLDVVDEILHGVSGKRGMRHDDVRAQQREWRYTQPEGGENGQNSYH